MPADTTKPPAPKRQPRKVTEEEQKDIELKRLKGEISCAECRRLKLKCDKKVPCSSCVRRGCESICPLGVLSAGQGTRFILADTAELHHKIAQMSSRIRQLEEALEILQDGHPLLSEDMLRIKFGSEVFNAPNRTNEGTALPPTIEESVDALGTLTLNDEGDVKYYGSSGGSETLLMAGEDYEIEPSIEEGEDDDSPQSSSLRNLMHSRPTSTSPTLSPYDQFPFTPKQKKLNARPLCAILSQLPAMTDALKYAHTFNDLGSLFFRPMKEKELIEEFIPSIYAAAARRAEMAMDGVSFGTPGSAANGPSPSPSPSFWSPSLNPTSPQPQASSTSQNSSFHLDPHSLATLFFALAIGALLDTSLPAYSDLAERLYDLGRASLSLRPVFHNPGLATVQAVALMSTYYSLGPKKYSRDSVWCLMSLAAKLGQSLGLHRDGSRWRFSPEMIQKRRQLFWEVFSAEITHCLALGRPPSIHLTYVDCEFPADEEATTSSTGEPEYGFWRLKYVFAKSLFMDVAHVVLSAQAPSYATILELDRKVRQIPFPEAFRQRASDSESRELERQQPGYKSAKSAAMEDYASQLRTVTLLYLHRSFFAQAMLSHPQNPLLSPFAPSVLTSYRCSSVIINAGVRQEDRCPEIATRIWFLQQHMFSAAIIVGSVVARTPSSNMAPAALRELVMVAELLERSAGHSQRAKVAAGVVRRLEGKAMSSWNAYHSGDPPSPSVTTNGQRDFAHPSGEDEFEDALAMFGGQARQLPRKPKLSVDATGSATNSPSSTASGEFSPIVKKSSIPHIRSPSNPASNASSFPAPPALVTPTQSTVNAASNTASFTSPPISASDFLPPLSASPLIDVHQSQLPAHLLPYYTLSQPNDSRASSQDQHALTLLRGDMGTSAASMFDSMVGDFTPNRYAKSLGTGHQADDAAQDGMADSAMDLEQDRSVIPQASSAQNSQNTVPLTAPLPSRPAPSTTSPDPPRTNHTPPAPSRSAPTNAAPIINRPQLRPAPPNFASGSGTNGSVPMTSGSTHRPSESAPASTTMPGWPENFPRSITLVVPLRPSGAAAARPQPMPSNRQRSHPYASDGRSRHGSTSGPSQSQQQAQHSQQSHNPQEQQQQQEHHPQQQAQHPQQSQHPQHIQLTQSAPLRRKQDPVRHSSVATHEITPLPVGNAPTFHRNSASSSSLSSALQHPEPVQTHPPTSAGPDIQMMEFEDDDLMVPVSPEDLASQQQRGQHQQTTLSSSRPMGLGLMRPSSYEQMSFAGYGGGAHVNGNGHLMAPGGTTGLPNQPSGELIDMGLATGTGMDQSWFSFVGQSGLWEATGQGSANGYGGAGGAASGHGRGGM
ncbi:fungal-specific transcription factor domain-containing protein [Pterulicium gracile]|uniref:Fungal-specific transcription factor domain-containing protein n=1 Tax=Pterulicium gracile TaxID=1884261 RepID=A0A5C3Q4T3_9AGAR|nr:fungal-specific transcription factor domain-containing protein [Pterula gracilis]